MSGTSNAPTLAHTADAALIRRVNQLYHDLTQAAFDDEHRHRHRVERAFWSRVATTFASHTAWHTASDAASPPASDAPRRVVDLACGSGFVAGIVGRTLDPRDCLLAVDVSKAALQQTARKYARHTNGNAARLVCLSADGQHLPLDDASVQLCAINAALHHMPDPAAVLREVDRVLAPGGWFALGFEPNIRHFASFMGAASRGFDRLAWYASPRQNLRRIRAKLGLPGTGATTGTSSEQAARTIGDALAANDHPLAAADVLALVDPHARGADHVPGFDPAALLTRFFNGYEVIRLFTSDYLGEAPRRCRPLRAAVDATLRLALPRHGSLFSWIIRKPAAPSGKEGAWGR